MPGRSRPPAASSGSGWTREGIWGLRNAASQWAVLPPCRMARWSSGAMTAQFIVSERAMHDDTATNHNTWDKTARRQTKSKVNMNQIADPPRQSAPPLQKETLAGNYFVSNYPPYSFWKPELTGEFLAALERPPSATPLGIYVHIPFCRKRCHFCYFKVYTDKDSASIRGYIDALLQELALY